MILSLQHTRLMVRDIDAAVAAYVQVLGVEPAIRNEQDGVGTAIFTLSNSSLRIVAPVGSGDQGDALRTKLDEAGEGLSGLTFEVDDIERAHRRLRRLSLQPSDVSESMISDALTGRSLSWRGTTIEPSSCHGIDIALVQSTSASARSPVVARAPVSGIDLVVVATTQPERAIALYGARLGLDFVFDRLMGEGATRLMQFAVGEQMVEVTHRVERAGRDGPDALWGIAWSVSNIAATQARLKAAGRNVSAVKVGAKPGTQVCTLRDGTCGVPTLIVQTDPRGAVNGKP